MKTHEAENYVLCTLLYVYYSPKDFSKQISIFIYISILDCTVNFMSDHSLQALLFSSVPVELSEDYNNKEKKVGL